MCGSPSRRWRRGPSACGSGPIITPLARRRPWKIARETVSLDHLCGGRLTLPVGLGAVEDGAFSKVGEPTERRLRAQRLDESLEILSGLWSGRAFGFDGQHYQLEEMTFLPTPVQAPRIPVWVVGAWPNERSMERALRWDGVMPARLGPDGWSADMRPEDIRALAYYVDERRKGPFDIVIESRTLGGDPDCASSQVQLYADAGATWWIEAVWTFLWEFPGDLDPIRRRIRQGPPRVP